MTTFSFGPITYSGDQISGYNPSDSLDYYDRVTVNSNHSLTILVYHSSDPAAIQYDSQFQYTVTLTDATTSAVKIVETQTAYDGSTVSTESDGQIIDHSAGAILVQLSGYIFEGQHYSSSAQDLFTNSPIFNGSVTVYPDDTGGTFVPLPCYRAGTRILTGQGEVAIEHLREGDRVFTVSGLLCPVRWIGNRHVDLIRHPVAQMVQPVRIRAHAFGDGLPCRDLFLSPDHAVWVEDVLIPVKHLINGTSIAQQTHAEVTYYHVELDRHDVIIADGLPCETYLETGQRASFANGSDAIRLHPDFARVDVQSAWEAFGYAPLKLAGPAVERTRQRLASLTSPPSPPPVPDAPHHVSALPQFPHSAPAASAI